MIDIDSQSKAPQTDLHLLPCSINYNGPADVTSFFHPQDDPSSESSIAYFRGRRLLSTRLSLKENYTGMILDDPISITRYTPDDRVQSEIDMDLDSDLTPSKTANVVGVFNDITLWGHDSRPDEAGLLDGEIGTGVYVAIKEYIGNLSSLIHSDPDTKEPNNSNNMSTE